MTAVTAAFPAVRCRSRTAFVVNAPGRTGSAEVGPVPGSSPSATAGSAPTRARLPPSLPVIERQCTAASGDGQDSAWPCAGGRARARPFDPGDLAIRPVDAELEGEPRADEAAERGAKRLLARVREGEPDLSHCRAVYPRGSRRRNVRGRA